MSRPDIDVQQIETQQYEPPDPSDERLIALFDKLEEQQLDFLDQAGKRVIELSTGMLGLLFAVTAFGKEVSAALSGRQAVGDRSGGCHAAALPGGAALRRTRCAAAHVQTLRV